MSMDLVVLAAGSAGEYEQALRVYYGDEPVDPDAERLAAFADALDREYDEGNWPSAGDPIVMPGHVLLTVAPEAWDDVVPSIVETAHRHGLVALDPQEEMLFPPGTPYELAAASTAGAGGLSNRVEVTVHRGDGRVEDLSAIHDDSRWWTWTLRRLFARIRRKRAFKAFD
jgi:hypothetical protein